MSEAIAHNAAMRIEADGDDVLVWVKAVPGASRDEIAGEWGAVGERLKVRVAAPPEGGRANRAIVKLLAGAIGVKAAQVSIESGGGGPAKVVRVADCSVEAVRRALAVQS